jgi:uncharacterized protein YfaS (alpha-2-macroglobulin family)
MAAGNPVHARAQPPQPAVVLGWSPGVGRNVPPAAPITVYFNQAMDRASVERAWHLSPGLAGRFTWPAGRPQDAGTAVTFTPAHPLRTGAYYRLTLDRTARSATGTPLEPFSVAFSTGDALQVTSYSPWNGTKAVPANGLIAITFNHPMVALAGLSVGSRNPPGWRVLISPRVAGYGSWLGTSTWIFHPSNGLQPSSRYTVTLSRWVRDAWGQPLGHDLRWSFQTITPEIYSRSPRKDVRFADPRGPITVTFNQAMNNASTARAFSLRAGGAVVPGSITWKRTALVFHPSAPLQSDRPGTLWVTVTVEASAQSANGRATLGKRNRWQFSAAPPPQVVSTQPDQGGTAYDSFFSSDGGYYAPPGYGGPLRPGSNYAAALHFNTPMNKRSLDHHLSISPALSRMDTWFYGPDQNAEFPYGIYGDFKPSTRYTITIRAGVRDAFGRILSSPYTLTFKTGRLRPSVALYGMPGGGDGISFSAGRIVDAPVQFVNVPKVSYTLVRISLAQLAAFYQGCCSNGAMTPPAGKTVRSWTEQIPHPLNKVQNLGVRLTQKSGSPLAPGLYWLGATTSNSLPGLPPGVNAPVSWELVVVTNLGITVKTGQNGTLVWVTSAGSPAGAPSGGRPAKGLRVQLVNYQGGTVLTGTTNTQGMHFFPRWTSSWGSATALVDIHTGGDTTGGHFGLAKYNWQPNITSPSDLPFFWGWQSGPSSNGTYLYTDRPVYRPGQRVSFRGVLWRDQDGVYSLLGRQRVTVQAVSAIGRGLYHAQVKLDRFGVVHGSFLLPRNTATGGDNLFVGIPKSIGVSTGFTVAEYRKPEFLTTIKTKQPEYAQGQTLTATVSVRYVFGVPVTHQRVSWVAYAQPLFAQPPGWDGYTFFDWETFWQQTMVTGFNNQQQSQFGTQVAQGTGTTNGQGTMTIRLPVNLAKELVDQTITVEATATDINHQSVSSRVQLPEYKSALAIGLSAQHEVVPAGQQARIDVVAVKHDGTALAHQPLTAKIFKRTYSSKLVNNGSGQSSWQAVPHDALIETRSLKTDTHGKASVAFTPKDGGEYYVLVQGTDTLGNTTHMALSVYASAEGFSDWGPTNDTSLTLKPDKATYKVGDTAHVLVAAPFDHAAALVTLERGNIRKYWVQQLATNSSTVDVPITLGDLPNVFLTVTLYHGWRGTDPPEWRYGTAELHIRVDPRHLMVHLAQTGYRHRPGDPVTYTVTTTDTRGRPVSAQLSLALVDTAVLALQDENNPDILKALYSERALGVSTASDGVISVDHLKVTPDFQLRPPGGFGAAKSAAPIPTAAPAPTAGGGGGGYRPPTITVRSRFADTAYWMGSLVTDRSGHGTLHLKLPDNATTWRLDARGVTVDQRVGQARLSTLATKDFLVRPVVPRFLVEGDTLQLGAILNDNLGRPVDARVSVAASGLTIRSGPAARVRVPAHGERLLLWQVNVPQGSIARLTFIAAPSTGGVQGDAVRLTLPVHPPLTDETVATAGQVFGGMKQLIIVPRNAVPRPGALTVQVSASLTAGLGAAYDEFRQLPGESNEDVADRVLAAASLHSLPASITGLPPSSYRRLPLVLAAGVQKLLDHQYGDGGWPWFNDPLEFSDPEITADAVQALSASGHQGPLVRQSIARARRYLRQQLASVSALPAAERAHLLLVLALSGPAPRSAAEQLYHFSVERSHLDPGPLADLGRTLRLGHESLNSGTVVSLLDSRAVVSATGAHWESSAWGYWDEPAIATTTQVLAALVLLSPQDPFVPAAVRWIMFARQGPAWDCSHDSAQAIAALAAYARAAREGKADYQYRVMIDRSVKAAGRYSAMNQRYVSTSSVPISRLQRGRPSTLTIDRQIQTSATGSAAFGTGPLYYVSRLHYYLRADSIAPRSEGISVGRRYLNLRRQPIARVSAGSPVQVELTIHTDQTLLYLDVQDPIPVGFEPIDQSLNTSQQGLFRVPGYPLAGVWPYGQVQDLIWYLSHSDLRDDRVSLYGYYLPPGTYRYTYLAQATVPGRYGVPPTHVSETFFPEVFGRSAGQTFTVL